MNNENQVVPPRDATTSIEEARQHVGNIQDQLCKIYAIDPELKQIQHLEESIHRCHTEFQQAARKLERPALRIATIGTTSAGKSTLVNGLVGRQIAPMDASELSAGVLHLVHRPQRRITIKAVEGLWPAIDRTDVDDDGMYKHIREKVFKIYHEAKKDRTITIPEIRIEGPLLLPTILDLPDGVEVEIYDLPGLNSVLDKTNLEVIQSHLRNCFSLVAMDYGHTDAQSRAELLKEVAEVVDALGGRTDTLLFVLNRVDMRKETDDPLEIRTAHFAKAIQEKLKLPAKPNIIDTSSIALFYAQCAWGWNRPEGEPTASQNHQKQYLKHFIVDCSSFIKKHQNQDKDIKTWFRDIEDAENDVDFSALLTPELLQKWVTWTWRHSGALNLINELRKRIVEQFAEVVIAPVLIQPLAALDVLLSQLDDYDAAQRLESKDAADKQKAELKRLFEELQNFLARQGEEFQTTIQQAVADLSQAMASADEKKIAETLRALFGLSPDDPEPESLTDLRQLEGVIKQDLLDHIVVPVRDYFQKAEPTDTLKEKLKAVRAEERQAICKAAETYRARGMGGEFVWKGIQGDQTAKSEKDLDHIIHGANSLFAAMRGGFSQRALYLLQAHHGVIEDLQHTLRERGIADIEHHVRDALPDAADTLLALYRQKLGEMPLKPLKDDMFEMPSFKKEKDSKSKEYRDRAIASSCLLQTEQFLSIGVAPAGFEAAALDTDLALLVGANQIERDATHDREIFR